MSNNRDAAISTIWADGDHMEATTIRHDDAVIVMHTFLGGTLVRPRVDVVIIAVN